MTPEERERVRQAAARGLAMLEAQERRERARRTLLVILLAAVCTLCTLWIVLGGK